MTCLEILGKTQVITMLVTDSAIGLRLTTLLVDPVAVWRVSRCAKAG